MCALSLALSLRCRGLLGGKLCRPSPSISYRALRLCSLAYPSALYFSLAISMSATASMATVDGIPVPPKLSLRQIQAMLPRGLLGLHDAEGTPIFPEEDGSLLLTAGRHYFTNDQHSNGNNRASTDRDDVGIPSSIMTPTAGSPHVRFGAQLRGQGLGTQQSDANSMLYGGSSQLRSKEGRSKPRGKLLLDRVHEHVALSPLVASIVDTPEFQRLRMLKQVGSTFYIYPGACHTRFEHSVGVAHLAGLMVKKIARRQPELEITQRDIDCVMIAGLCHDLGHGPFSHLFERIVTTIRESQGDERAYHHEAMSLKLLRRIISRLNLQSYNWTEEDTCFVELMIEGLPPRKPWPKNVGRPVSKRFLCEIVANKRCGIDVDKLDYFMRDSLCCYGRATVDCHISRLIASCSAMKGADGEMQLCFEEKMAMSLGDIFGLRAKLHKHAYQHRVARAIDLMFADALLEADPYFTVRGGKGQALRISQAVEDVDGFCLLGDWIFDAIAGSPDPKLCKAQEILRRIHCRDLYSFAGVATLRDYNRKVDTAEFMRDLLSDFSSQAAAEIEPAVVVDTVAINYGSSDTSGAPDDPIKNVSFFNPKSSSQQAHRLSVTKQSPLFRPQQFGEKSILLFVKDKRHVPAVVGAFDLWKASNSHQLIDAVPVSNVPQTPARTASKRSREED